MKLKYIRKIERGEKKVKKKICDDDDAVIHLIS